MTLDRTASALGLYKYRCDHPGSTAFGRFYETALAQFQACNIAPTYIAADGQGYSGKLVKAGSRTHDRLLKSGFNGVTVLTLSANPPGSDAPAFDSFASASLSYAEAARELLLCVVVNEALIRFGSPQYDELVQSMIDLHPWDFGYGFAAPVEEQPDFHILGLDNGKLPPDDYAALRAWYDASPELRVAKLRGLYPSTIVNEAQLGIPLASGLTLRQFAERQEGTSLTRLAREKLFLWSIPRAQLAGLRKALAGSSALIS